MKTKKTPNQVFAVKFRIYPNKNGTAFLKKCFAASRKYWNWQVDRQVKMWNSRKEREEQWAKEGKDKKDFRLLDIGEADKEFRKLRSGEDEEFNWIQDTPSRLVGGIYKRQNVAWREGFKKRKKKGFWRNKKDFAKKPLKGFPKFRSWRDNQYFDCESNQMKWDWGKSLFKLPVGEGWIKFKQHINVEDILKEYPNAKLGMCVFTCSPTGKYHFIMPIDTGVPLPEKKEYDESSTVGIDVGIRNYISLSDETKIDNNTFLQKFGLDFKGNKLSPYKTNPRLTRRKKIRQRRLSRKESKSKNYNKDSLARKLMKKLKTGETILLTS